MNRFPLYYGPDEWALSEYGVLYFHGDAGRPDSPCAQGHLYLSMRRVAVGRAGEAGERHPLDKRAPAPASPNQYPALLNVLSVIQSLML
jgi:hypothetical protein